MAIEADSRADFDIGDRSLDKTIHKWNTFQAVEIDMFIPTSVFGVVLLAAAVIVLWFTYRPTEGAKVPGIQIPFLFYAGVLLIGGIFALADVSWATWPSGLWLMIVGGSVATVGLLLFAWIMPDFTWGLIAFAVGSLVALIGPVGLGVAYLAQHISATWI